MRNFRDFSKDKQIHIRIHSKILSNPVLSLNEKLVLGLHYTFDEKLGKTVLTNKEIGELLHLHPNIVSCCHKKLLKRGLIVKKKNSYEITKVFLAHKVDDRREIRLPKEIYQHPKISTGMKLLWGEYNSLSKGIRDYYAGREYTSNRLNVSKESISKWTKKLLEHKLLTSYSHKRGHGCSQRVVVTTRFG